MEVKKLRPARALQFCTLLCVLLSNPILAHNNVVVIPLAGDDAPAVPGHPVADTFTNSVGMRFNKLPAGTFTMGSPGNEPGRGALEDEHQVTLSKGFHMQVTEVTNAQWIEVMESDPSASHSPGANFPNYPVDFVTWFDAVLFANTLSAAEGKSLCYAEADPVANCTGYRLPTEAEWEYAARATTTTAYANPIYFDSTDQETGSGLNGNLHAMGWYSYNNELSYVSGTKPVAKKQANAWGLHDMAGNVVEWNQDWDGIYSGDTTNPTGPASGSFRVVRGGSWFNGASFARSAGRSIITPSGLGANVGFRVVLP
jgi:formylglycine-generating enzyme required for sulfatase activity